MSPIDISSGVVTNSGAADVSTQVLQQSIVCDNQHSIWYVPWFGCKQTMASVVTSDCYTTAPGSSSSDRCFGMRHVSKPPPRIEPPKHTRCSGRGALGQMIIMITIRRSPPTSKLQPRVRKGSELVSLPGSGGLKGSLSSAGI